MHVDIEGGWGGSSRSLFELVSRLPRNEFEPLVAHRQPGPLTARYAAIGIRTVEVPEIGSYVPRQRGAIRNLVLKTPQLMRTGAAARRMASIAREQGIDLVHLNHDGLFLLAAALKRQIGLPLIVHCRAAGLADNLLGRWLAGNLARHAQHIFFISPNEETRYRLCQRGAGPPSEVMWNIASVLPERLPLSEPPEAVFLGNIDHSKGVDRLFDLAEALDLAGAPPLRIAIYGKARNSSTYARDILRRCENVASGRIEFRGYTDSPESVLRGAFALLRPSRGNDPWGRDVIEAACSGVPVLATGEFDGVVQPGRTGYLFPQFEPAAMARALIDLLQDGAMWQSMSVAAQALAVERFGGSRQIEQFRKAARQAVPARLAGAKSNSGQIGHA